MEIIKKIKRIFMTLAFTVFALSTTVSAAPFGEAEDITYSQNLWSAMVNAGYVGPNSIMSHPYTGTPPHGKILDTFDGTVTVNGTTGAVIVKRNYGGPDVSIENVANEPAKYLKAITVMFKRRGFDPEDKDWFWVKYKPDGSLHENEKGMKLAGKIAKGMSKGCIACHKAAPGGDFMFNYDRIK